MRRSHQSSVISDQSSVISDQSSVISHESSDLSDDSDAVFATFTAHGVFSTSDGNKLSKNSIYYYRS